MVTVHKGKSEVGPPAVAAWAARVVRPRQNDLSWRSWAVVAAAPMIVLVVLHFANRALLHFFMAKDANGAPGVIEIATVLVLVPAIVAGAVAMIWHRAKLPSRRLILWLLAWTLACLYFAGEECSWGQRLFGYQTPSWLESLNKQDDVTLHNISSWFHQKPRFLVGMWILVGALLVPAWRRVKKRGERLPTDWRYWFWPTKVCVVPAALILLLRIFKEVEEYMGSGADGTLIEVLAASELHEFYVAVFLMIYLASIWFRLRSLPAAFA